MEFALASVIAVWWVWPLPMNLADHAIYPQGVMAEVQADHHLITWALAWDTHALLTDPRNLFQANIFFPARNALAFSEHFLGYLPLFAPIYVLTGNPILSANVLLLLTYPLCTVAMAALARRFVAPPAALAAGLLFAFCGQRYLNLYHYHQLGTFWLPAALLFTDRWLERARARDAVALATCVALQLLSSYYLGYAMICMLGAALPVLLWRSRGSLDRYRLVGIGLALILGALPALAASVPYLEMQRLGLVPSARGDEVSSLLTMDPRMTALQIGRYLGGEGLGPLGWILAATGVVFGARAAGGGRALGLVVALVGLLLAAGPRVMLLDREIWSPYVILQWWLPGFAAVRLPARFLVLTHLGATLLAAIGLDQILARSPLRSQRGRLAAALAASGIIIAFAVRFQPHDMSRVTVGASTPPVYAWLRDQGEGGAVLELPNGDPAVASRRMLLGTTHWLPMLDGYSAYPPLTRNYLRRVAAELPAEEALQALVDAVAVRWIVVHLDEMTDAERRRWEALRLPGLQPAGRFGDDLLFAVDRAVVHDVRERLLRTDVTLSGIRLANVTADCAGSMRAVPIQGAAEAPAGGELRLALEIDNRSPNDWPGTGFYPRYVVKLSSSYTTVAGARAATEPEDVWLWSDMASNRTTTVFTTIGAPAHPGRYELSLDLIQDGVPFSSCGFKAARLPVRITPRAATTGQKPR